MREKQLEYRIALVMNGGVSLAVWMAGVAHELDLLRRASQSSGDPSEMGASSDKGVWKAWREACTRSNVGRVAIDVIAGTSAGGLNGTLLAAAIARGGSIGNGVETADQSSLRDLWVNRAGFEVGKLLPSPDSEPKSLLDGDYFQDQINNVLEKIGGESSPDTVTLFITSTATGRSDVQFADSFGQRFIVADHRRLYRFRCLPDNLTYVPATGFSPSPLNEFNDESDALGRAARGSASYPVAFDTAEESCGLEGEPLRVRPKGDAWPTWLIDGGVLDNAPFGPVLDSITRRPAIGPFKRVLVYVVPSRGIPPRISQPIGNASPPWFSVVGSSIQFPRESDFRSDIEELQALLAAEDSSSRNSLNLFKGAVTNERSRALLLGVARGLFEIYRQGRAAGAVLEARRLVTGGGGAEPITLSPTLESILDDVLSFEPTWVDWEADGFDALEFSDWRWGLSAAERTVRLMFRHVRGLLSLSPDETLLAASVGLSACLNRIEAIRDEAEARLGALDPEVLSDDSNAVAAINNVMLDLSVPEVSGEQVRISGELYREAIDEDLTGEDAILCAFSVELVTRALNAGAPFRRTAPFDFLRLGPDIDTPALAEGPPTATVQAPGDRKLYGIRAMHFGAFGNPDWRRWDWTWGRLDAITHLGRALGRDDGWIAATQRMVLEAEGWTLNQFAGRLEDVVELTDTDLIRELGSEHAGRQSLEQLLDRALDLLSGTQEPAMLGKVGRWLSVVFRTKQPEKLGIWERLWRGLTGGLRKRIWKWVSRG